MSDHTNLHTTPRSAAIAPAMVACQGWVMCPVWTLPTAIASWADIYQQAYEQAVRTVHRKYPGRVVPPSMN